MRLFPKLTFAFFILAWAPLLGAVGILTTRMEDAFAEGAEVRSQQVIKAVQGRFSAVSSDLEGALAKMATDPVLAQVLLDPLERGQFFGDAERERALIREARRLITTPAISTLRIVDGRDGRVLALGHRVGHEPNDAQVTALMADPEPTDARPILRTERIDNQAAGTAEPVWTVQTVHRLTDRIALVGGRILDDALLVDMAGAGAIGVALVIQDKAGRRIAGTIAGARPAWADDEGREWVQELGAAPKGDAPLTLRVFQSEHAHRSAVNELWATAFALAIVAAALALIAGLWVSRRISRPLETLSEAAARVAGGAWDERVAEPSGRDEVAALTRAFNQMTDDLQSGEERLRQSERVAAWREIARRIAHEIKNPLFPIQMSIQNLQKARSRQHPDFDEIFEESTETVLEEVARMVRIVDEFSNFARMPEPRPESLDLAELAHHIASLHGDAAAGVSIAVHGPDPAEAWGDPDQLRQLLTNLVLNAVQSMGGRADTRIEPPRVDIRMQPQADGRMRLTVADNGPGMGADVLGRLFTPYFTTKASGTGLGLAVVHRIVEEHGGTVSVTSAIGEGTEFTLWLPGAPESEAGC